jgi:ribosomal protein S17E
VFSFTTEDVVGSLKRAGNINAALKNFLKREVRRGDPAERFVKDLREVMVGKDETRALNYIEKRRPGFDSHLVAIGSYAHSEMVMVLANQIVEKYADRFNATYEVKDEDIAVKDKKEFESIMKEVSGVITQTLKEAGFGDSVFMQSVIFSTVFDRPVLRYLVSNN